MLTHWRHSRQYISKFLNILFVRVSWYKHLQISVAGLKQYPFFSFFQILNVSYNQIVNLKNIGKLK